MLMWKMA